MNPAQHISQAVKKQKRVYFVGTANTTYHQGIGLCYNRDYGTATDNEGERDKRVEVPSTSNNRDFAGVLDRTVTLDSTGEGWVTINEPGSVCNIALGEDSVVNTTILTCLAGGGDNTSRFTDKGFMGRGTAKVLQTQTALLEDSRNSAYNSANLATDGVTLTVSDSSDFTAGTDKVLILSGEDEGSSKSVNPGIYDISSITDGTTIVLDSSAVNATPGAAVTCSYVVIDMSNATALAYLYDGPESGLVYYSSPPNAGGDSQTYMTAGVNFIQAAALSADAEYELADGTQYGERVGFVLKNAHNTSDSVVDLATAGLQLDGSALAEINAIDAASDAAFLEWVGIWRTIGIVGGATEA